jgi:hypothetical protein
LQVGIDNTLVCASQASSWMGGNTETVPKRASGRSPRSRLLAQNKVARITESVAAFYGALPATTPMLATVSPFFIEGTAQTYRTTPLDGARASHTVLPNRSVT